jgi:hypothetical protein
MGHIGLSTWHIFCMCQAAKLEGLQKLGELQRTPFGRSSHEASPPSVVYKRGGQGTSGGERSPVRVAPCPFHTLAQSDESTVKSGDLAQLLRINLPRPSEKPHERANLFTIRRLIAT